MFNFFNKKKILPYDISNNDGLCTICLSPLSDKPTIFLEKCLHEYHIDCIYEWVLVKPNCPSCRSCQKNARAILYYQKNKSKSIFEILQNLLSTKNNTLSLII